MAKAMSALADDYRQTRTHEAADVASVAVEPSRGTGFMLAKNLLFWGSMAASGAGLYALVTFIAT
ncbi:hypothetical protein E1180_01090 [Roseibium denhamense]|uniref:MFS transporter n=1 Tax=Roseibium denhamense TaxID=76305 RepID=A0ABY1PNT2_9HYPH|nr:hypothetical protein [Roseibium denhamense]MTI04111.1 hypothetical protein [Roseibium denhamense]SMP37356.1 hypothetical protein SAMN06265374_0073 [Roseibium denhamense]